MKAVIEDRRVAAVTLTGSNAAGGQVASTAGKAIKTTVLELGGSDPFIVMPGADLDTAVATAVKARVVNNGQSCIAAKRFIVAEPVADEFERRFVAAMEALVVGEPMDPATDVGPLASEAQLGTIADQVERSVAAGARVLTGGRKLDRAGWYYAPTVLTGITPESPAYHEEVFGPVALLFRVNRDRRCDPAGQRLTLRPGRQRLDPERRRAGPVHHGDRGRHGVRQRDGGLRPPGSVRRSQGIRVWSGAEPLRHPGVRQHQDGLGRVT